MANKLSFVFAFLLVGLLVACGDYNFVPKMYFDVEVTPNSGALAPGTQQTLRLYNFNTKDLSSLNIDVIKLDNTEIKGFQVNKSDTQVEINYTIPSDMASFENVLIGAQNTERGRNMIVVKF